jgi:hypothetical protein
MNDAEIESLLPYATERQAEYLEAIREHGGQRAAARHFDVRMSAVAEAVKYVRKKAAAAGWAPENGLEIPNPEGFITGKVTVQQRGQTVERVWKRMSPSDTANQELAQQYIRWLASDAEGRAGTVEPPQRTDAEILAAYPIFDPHFGLYSWKPETGENYDLDEAERRVTEAADRLVYAMPSAEQALIALGGDVYHINDESAETPASKNRQDTDTRFVHVAEVGFRAITHVVERARQKHAHVHVRPVRGNHDPDALMMMAIALRSYYRDEPRVTIDVDPCLYAYHRFGKVLIGLHHGHGARMNELPLLMAADRPQDWGATEHRYWYCGHIHHKTKDKEHPGVMVETFNTLAGTDAWHYGKGYRHVAKNMQAILHHAEDGEVERHTCSLGRLNRLGQAA